MSPTFSHEKQKYVTLLVSWSFPIISRRAFQLPSMSLAVAAITLAPIGRPYQGYLNAAVTVSEAGHRLYLRATEPATTWRPAFSSEPVL